MTGCGLMHRRNVKAFVSKVMVFDGGGRARSIRYSDIGRRLDRVLSTATTRTRPCRSC